jgi:hemoglobin
LEWLNRAQCIGVGRVDMTALRVEFDVYLVRVAGQAGPASREGTRTFRPAVAQPASLYERLGGYDVISPAANDFISSIFADQQLGRFFVSGYSEARVKAIRQQVVNQLCELTGGPCFYTGHDMKTVHKGLGITEADWKIALDLLAAALDKYRVAPQEQSEFLQIIKDMKSAIVENSGESWK